MRKPNNPKAEAKTEEPSTREAILRAAGRVFLKKGYEGASMDQVAQESGAGRRTVYNHFPSKKALFDATVALLWEGMQLDNVIPRKGSARSPEQALCEIGNTIADFWVPEDAIAFARMIISEGGRFPELTQGFATFGRGPVRRAVSDYLRSLHESRALKIPDPELAAAQFIGLITTLLVWNRVIDRSSAPSKERRRYVVDEAVRTILCRYSIESDRESS
jgi:AcrR family transcriptional regulator